MTGPAVTQPNASVTWAVLGLMAIPLVTVSLTVVVSGGAAGSADPMGSVVAAVLLGALTGGFALAAVRLLTCWVRTAVIALVVPAEHDRVRPDTYSTRFLLRDISSAHRLSVSLASVSRRGPPVGA